MGGCSPALMVGEVGCSDAGEPMTGDGHGRRLLLVLDPAQVPMKVKLVCLWNLKRYIKN